MLLLAQLDFSLPLKNPVLLFSLILFIILFAPILLNKLKIPHLIGLIIAGAVIGPNGLHLMLRDSSIVLFGTVGLLYIMFLAGLEIDLAEFKKNSLKSLTFGMYTFIIPMVLGTFSGIYLLGFTVPTSVLLASMFASHTLIAYPIISKLGVTKNRAVNITVGGTMITDTLALLVLAAIAGMSSGEVDEGFWLRLALFVIAFGLVVMFGFPFIARWFFKRFDDNISQYIFVLAMVFLAAFLAEAAGIEAIIGAFLAGLALNRLIPRTSPLMNRVEFVGNALFIPFFLIGVGMLIDFRVFFKDLETIKVAMVMVVIATLAKYIAAWLAQKTFKFTSDERRLIFGLSNAQAAATLAAVLVGYNIILNKAEIAEADLAGLVVEPVRLLSESVLNGTILMILVTCTIASFVAQKGAQNIALLEGVESGQEEHSSDERILIPIANPGSVEELVTLSLTVKSANNKSGLFALNVIDSKGSENGAEKTARKIMDKAVQTAAATDNKLLELIRYDVNTVNGIVNVVREQKISDLILGLARKSGLSTKFLGNLTEGILTRCNITTLIYKSAQPLSTVKRYIVVVPEKAEMEIGFPFWIMKLWNIARNTGAKLVFYGPIKSLDFVRALNVKHPVPVEFEEFIDWDDFLIVARDVKKDDCLVVVMSRKDWPSYHPNMNRVPVYLNKYFEETNFILIYPIQAGVNEQSRVDLKSATFLEPLEKLDALGKTIAGIFKRKG
jgi:Kef-type K+ transport system membrane component KefB/nucleotide-binding universal stress UspA family protein